MSLEISSFLTEISSFLPKNHLKNNEFFPQKPSNLLIFEFRNPAGILNTEMISKELKNWQLTPCNEIRNEIVNILIHVEINALKLIQN